MTKNRKTLKVPVETWHQAKIEAARLNITLCDLAVDAIKQFLEAKKSIEGKP